MKNKLKLLSLITVSITILLILVSLFLSIQSEPVTEKEIDFQEYEKDNILQTLNQIQELSMIRSADTITTPEEDSLVLMQSIQIAELKSKLIKSQELREMESSEVKEDVSADYNFWIKVVFSFVFCLSALYVVLSQKYDDDTKKWAYSVLTLIAGVWIGTVS